MKKFFEVLNAVISPFLSRKLLMALTAIWMIYGVYWAAIQQLYTFKEPAQIVAFQQFTMYMMGGVTTIAMWYIGIQGAENWKGAMNVSSMLTSAISSTSEDKTETINIREEKLLTLTRVDPKDVLSLDGNGAEELYHD